MDLLSQNKKSAAASIVLRAKKTFDSIPIGLLALVLAILVPFAALLLPLLLYCPPFSPFSAPLVQLINTLPIGIVPKLADPGALLAEALHLESVSTVGNSPGVVRVNNLAMLEALINISGGGTEFIMITVGSFFILATLYLSRTARHRTATTVSRCQTNLLKDPKTMQGMDKGTRLIWAGIMVPVVLKWLIAVARDAALFN